MIENFQLLITWVICFSYLYNDKLHTKWGINILLVLGECHRNYRNASRFHAERYPDHRHPNLQQIINIERRSRQNLFHRWRQQNWNINNNNQRLIAVLAMVHLNAC